MPLTSQPTLAWRYLLQLTYTVTFMVYSLTWVQVGAAQHLQLSTETPKAGESVAVTGLELTLLTGGRYQLTVQEPDVGRTWQLTVPKPTSKPLQNLPDGGTKSSKSTQLGGQATGQTTAQSLTPPANSAAASALQVTRNETGVSAAQRGAPRWSLTFPAGSGPTTQPVTLSPSGSARRLYLGHGNSVLRLEPQTGDVVARFIVSGPVARLEKLDEQTVGITVRHAQGLLERFTLKRDTLQKPVRFGTNPAVFGYLRAEANSPAANVTRLTARLRRDPTNPWLYLRLGLEQRDPATARQTFQTALNRATTFYDLAGLATVLERQGERTLAAAAFAKAAQDFADRGYDPRLLTDGALEAAYNFPLRPLERALNAGDDLSAGFWAERLWLAAPKVPGAAAALHEYAALLRRLGTPAQAALWETRASLRTPAPDGVLGGRLEHFGSALAQNGWRLVPALLLAFVALHLTLLAKYARARRSDCLGGYFPWLFALRYDTLSEKLVLLALLALALVCAALGSWEAHGQPPAQIVGSGTLTNRAAQAYLMGEGAGAQPSADFSGPRAAFIRGTTAQILGNTQKAALLLRSAGNYAPALNNLGVLTGSQTLYQRALELEPTLPAARYNTGTMSLLPFQTLLFQTRYRPGRSALALPTPADFSVAAGSWQNAVTKAFTQPQLIFNTPPYGLSLVLWRTVQLLFLLVALVQIGFLVVPRPRSAYGAPRGWTYLVAALLLPGTGLADELWGIFLLAPWAVLGAAALHLFGFAASGSALTLYLILAGIYAVNTVAVIVEGWSHRSERRRLERRRSVRS